MSKIKPKRSYTPGAVPTTSDLDANELVINWADGKAYTKTAAGNIVSVTLGGGGSGSSSLVTAASVSAFPATGSAANLYITTEDQRLWRWDSTASIYVESGPIGGGFAFASVPASATASGTTGQVATDGSYWYYCSAPNTWVRAALSTWAWSPANVTGLQVWLDGSDASTLYDATSGGNLVSVDGAIARWQDKSGNGYHFTKPSGSNSPVRKSSVQNGLGAVRYVASDGSLTVDSSNYLSYTRMINTSFSLAPPFTVFFCGNPTYSEGYQHNGTLLTSYNSTYTSGLYAFGSNASETPSQTIYTYAASRSFTARAPMLLTAVVSSSTTTGYRNGASAVTASNASSGFDGASLGALRGNPTPLDASYFMLGDMYEVIIYNSAISDANRAAVESYLMTKWGIT